MLSQGALAAADIVNKGKDFDVLNVPTGIGSCEEELPTRRETLSYRVKKSAKKFKKAWKSPKWKKRRKVAGEYTLKGLDSVCLGVGFVAKHSLTISFAMVTGALDEIRDAYLFSKNQGANKGQIVEKDAVKKKRRSFYKFGKDIVCATGFHVSNIALLGVIGALNGAHKVYFEKR